MTLVRSSSKRWRCSLLLFEVGLTADLGRKVATSDVTLQCPDMTNWTNKDKWGILIELHLLATMSAPFFPTIIITRKGSLLWVMTKQGACISWGNLWASDRWWWCCIFVSLRKSGRCLGNPQKRHAGREGGSMVGLPYPWVSSWLWLGSLSPLKTPNRCRSIMWVLKAAWWAFEW